MFYYKGDNIHVNIDELINTKEREAIIKKLKLKENVLKDFKILKKSLDARKRDEKGIFYNYSVSFRYPYKLKDKYFSLIKEEKNVKNNYCVKTNIKPVIIGSGPSSLFAALCFVKEGISPVILERGEDIAKRVRDVKEFWEGGKLKINSNVQFGLGGAGTFSDGKLNSRIKSPYTQEILSLFVEFGASREIMYLAKPHIGTDKLRGIVSDIKEYLEKNGAVFYFNSKVTDFIIKENKIKGVIVNDKDEFIGDTVIMGIGNGARDTFKKLNEKGVKMASKPFAVGFRAEHLQEEINKACYGKYYNHPVLKAGEYALKYNDDETKKGVYSFCNCPGGVVINSSSEENRLVTNGMSFYKRNMINANSAIVISVDESDFGKGVLDGIRFQEKIEEAAFGFGGGMGCAPFMSIREFLGEKGKSNVTPTFKPGVTESDLRLMFDDYLINIMKKAMKSYIAYMPCFIDGCLTAVESRTSSPVRILRDNETFESVNIKGLYPIGEGAGYAGGILSSAVDGYKVAKKIIIE